MIPVNEPLLDGNELNYLTECIETGWISSEGPFVSRFEEAFARRVSRKYGIAVCNGSAALELAVAALGIGPGDEVILPALTIISCAAAIVRAGAVPVVVDSDPCTWNMDVARVEEKITPRTKAIMIVHLYGLPADVAPLLRLAEKYRLKIIEDAAEMHGQTYQEKACGSFGDVSTFSFYPNKHVTTGEGGMVVVDDDDLDERCRSLRNLCFKSDKRFEHDELGWNFRMSNLQAAVGLAQLERLDEFVTRKRQMGRRYSFRLSGIGALQLPLDEVDYAKNIYWVYGLVLNGETSLDAIDVMERLKAKNVASRPFFWPIHEQPVFRKMGLFANESCPIAERLARRGFYLPSGLALTEQQLDIVSAAVREIFA